QLFYALPLSAALPPGVFSPAQSLFESSLPDWQELAVLLPSSSHIVRAGGPLLQAWQATFLVRPFLPQKHFSAVLVVVLRLLILPVVLLMLVYFSVILYGRADVLQVYFYPPR